MPADGWAAYEYAVVRLVPHVHLGAFVNVGVVLHARTARFLDVRLALDAVRLAGACPSLDADLVRRYGDAYRRICRGGSAAGPIGLLPPSERFHWLTAPRSAAWQTSPVRPGRTRDPAATLEHLFQMVVVGVTNDE